MFTRQYTFETPTYSENLSHSVTGLDLRCAVWKWITATLVGLDVYGKCD